MLIRAAALRLSPLAGVLAVFGAGILPCHGGPSTASAQSAPTSAVDIRISLTEWALKPAQITVPVGRPVRLLAVNAGILPHALAVEGEGLYVETETVGAGQSAPLEITFSVPGTYDLFCPVNAGQHRALGQEGVLNATAANLPFLLPRTGDEETEAAEDEDVVEAVEVATEGESGGVDADTAGSDAG